METPAQKLGYRKSFAYGDFHFYLSEGTFFAETLKQNENEHLASVSFNPEDHLSLRWSDLKLEQFEEAKRISGTIYFNIPPAFLHGDQTDTILLKKLSIFFSETAYLHASDATLINRNTLTFQAPGGGTTSIQAHLTDPTNAYFIVSTEIEAGTPARQLNRNSEFTAELWGRTHNFIVKAEQSSDSYSDTTAIYIGGTRNTRASDTQLAIESLVSLLRYKFGDIALPDWSTDIDAAALIEYEEIHQLTADEQTRLAKNLLHEKRVGYSLGHDMRPIKQRDAIHFIAEALVRRRRSLDESNHRD